ncbi:hypothetical protein [Spongiactinospora gelatinilytica]|uniref:hypothetical protein n=1 Tax=Spongiactinospora gelatinilytica TaxID=2666298 RepID=UPI0011B94989|nr:hypothetical protein [Spongiactinospora gelatinilytica]
MTPVTPRLLVLLGVGALALTAAGTAAADDPKGQKYQDGRTVGIELTHSQIILSGNGIGGKRGDGFRLKRPCWYEPGPDADQMLKEQEEVRPYFFKLQPNASEDDFKKYIKQFSDQVGKKGRWWRPAYNNKDPKGMACWTALEPFVFVPPGETPPGGITREELRDIARAALTVPEFRIRTSPAVKSYVNLSTYVWLTGMGATTRSVTATLPEVASATVTATLDDLKLDAGTTDADRVTKNCGGGRGQVYAKGNPLRCGIIYHQASDGQPGGAYELTATTVWGVTSDPQFDYEDIQVSATRSVPVGEVQTTVRESDSGS